MNLTYDIDGIILVFYSDAHAVEVVVVLSLGLHPYAACETSRDLKRLPPHHRAPVANGQCEFRETETKTNPI